MPKFRFEDLEIWKDSIVLADPLLDFADFLEDKKRYRFAEQLRAATLSISNNIAEGSGSSSAKDFANFLNIAKRSTFEIANMIFIFYRRELIEDKQKQSLHDSLDHFCRKISNFQKTLR